MVRTRGRASRWGGSAGWGELTSFAICMNYKRHTFPARVAAPVPPPPSPSIPAPPASAAPLAALLLWLCSALLYAPFPFPLSTCWVFSVCPAQLSHPAPLCTPFSLVIVVLLFSACTAAVVAVIWIVGLRYSRQHQQRQQQPHTFPLPPYPSRPVPGHVFDKTTAWHAT